MRDDDRVTVENCTLCSGSGRHRNGKHFFYAISLIASTAIMLFEWPPTPALFGTVSSLCGRIGLSDYWGETVVLVVTAIPAIFGVAFFYAWLNYDQCPRCEGRPKVVLSEQAREAMALR